MKNNIMYDIEMAKLQMKIKENNNQKNVLLISYINSINIIYLQCHLYISLLYNIFDLP